MEISRNIKKLRGRSAAELGMRGKQALSVLGERVFRLQTGEMSDRQLVEHISASRPNGRVQGLEGRIAGRIREGSRSKAIRQPGAFFPSLAQREAVVEMMSERFSKERGILIDRADRAGRGSFDLLGFRNLEFGDPIDWRLEPISGKRTPLDHWSRIDYLDPNVAGDKKITWELNRHSHFVTLGQAYWMTGDQGYARTFVAQATSWMDSNPPKFGINWASSLELSIRCISWIWALHLFADSESLDPTFLKRLVKYILVQATHIESYLSQYFSPNTHLTGEALGLFYIGAAFPEFRRSRAWRETGLRIMLEQLQTQVRADGVYFERSTYYHRYTADFYIHLLALANANDIELPASVAEAAERLLDHLMWITRPDGLSPLLGDDDGGRLISLGCARPDDFRNTLSVGAALFSRGDWKYVAGGASVDALWLLGPDAVGKLDAIPACPPKQNSREFPDGGVYVMRDGWKPDSTYVAVSCGAHGSLSGGHAHSDNLSVEFACNGTAWIVDPGTYSYTGDLNARDEMRSTSFHNTAMADGLPQSEPGGPFSWISRADGTCTEFVAGHDACYFEGSQDGYKRLPDPVSHSRTIFMAGSSGAARSAGSLPPYLIIRDRLSAASFHKLAVSYHFSPDVSLDSLDGKVRATSGAGAELRIAALGYGPVTNSLEKGWVSRCYGSRSESVVARYETQGYGDQELTSVILASVDSERPSAEALRDAESATIGLRLTANNVTEIVLFGGNNRQVEAESLKAEGKLATARFAGQEPIEARLFRGKSLHVDDWVLFAARELVGYCAIRRVAREVLDISIRGAAEFYLETESPTKKVVVNGMVFSIADRLEKRSFIRRGAGWELAATE